jgi:formyl-CoA transferase
LGDTGTGMLLAIGILGALYQRHTTGKGRRLQIAMQDAQLQYTRGAFVQHARSGEPAMRNGAKSLAGGMAPAGIYPCKPGGPNDYVYVFTSPANPEHWQRLLKVIGREDLTEDPRFATRKARGQHEAEIDRIISDWTRQHDKHEAMRLIGGAGVPAGAVLDAGDLLVSPVSRNGASSRPCGTPMANCACRLSRCASTAPRPRSNRRRCSASTPLKCSANGSA